VRAPSRARAIRATIDIIDDEQGLRVGLARCFQAHLGLRLRITEFQTCIRRVTAKDTVRWHDAAQELTLSAGGAVSAEDVAWKLATRFAEIAWRPLTPRLLLAALNITTHERLRWTKDGRLRLSGSIQVRQGGVVFSVPTYPISLAEELNASPDILCTWREQDAAVQGS
jgi:hypothetical protein